MARRHRRVGCGPSGVGGGGGDHVNGASPEELWELLAGGAEALGWESLGSVEGLFSRMG